LLLTVTYEGENAADLGYLLHKNPYRPQEFQTNHGRAYVFYPELSERRATAALLLDIDPIGLVRGRTPSTGGLFDYVNDRPYVSSSFMSVAISKVFGTALSGRSEERQELADSPLDLSASVTTLPCRGERERLRDVFAPLGYEVAWESFPTDEAFPGWGLSDYVTLSLRGRVRLRDLLNHLYVLMPVFDSRKHYWVGEDEVDKLLRHGGEWLSEHPMKGFIAERYLKRRRPLVNLALERLSEANAADGEILPLDRDEAPEFCEYLARRDSADSGEPQVPGDTPDGANPPEPHAHPDGAASPVRHGSDYSAKSPELQDSADGVTPPELQDPADGVTLPELQDPADGVTPPDRHDPADGTGSRTSLKSPDRGKPAAAGGLPGVLVTELSLNDQRLWAVAAELKSLGARKVIDLGCGTGGLLAVLLRDPQFASLAGMDVSHAALDRAEARLHLKDAGDALRGRVRLFQGSLTYRDARLEGYDAAAAVEVMEHLDIPRLEAFSRVLFGHARPGAAVLTTPNREYNINYPGLGEGDLRHPDHRFEWSREEFRAWARKTADRFGYRARFADVGDYDPDRGSPTQMAVFTLCA
jgi:SAM-dependent methyltransferase